MVRVVDCHVQLHSRTFFEAHVGRSEPPVAERHAGGYLFRDADGTSTPVPARHLDLDLQLRELAAQGVDTAVCGTGAYTVDHLSRREATELAMHLNEEHAELERRFRGRFYALALLPMQDAQAAIETLEHAVRALTLRGVSVSSGPVGEPVAARSRSPVFRRIAELGVPVFLGPCPVSAVARLLAEHPALTVVHRATGDGLPCQVASTANRADRLMFGSGHPHASAADGLAAIRGRLEGAELHAALSGNAAAILGLS